MGYVVERRSRRTGVVRYTAMYLDLRGERHSAGTFPTKREATKAWQRMETEAAAGKIGDPRRGRQPFADYVQNEWFPHHMIEASTRQSYTYLINRYLVPKLGPRRMAEILPSHIREWVVEMQREGAEPPTIRQCKVIMDAIFTTALNDQVTFLHPGRGVKTPQVAKKPRRIVTPEQFDRLYEALADPTMQLLVETDIETGLRWGELTELRPKDFDFATAVLTVARVAVELNPKFHPAGKRFLIKDYPKDGEWRRFRVGEHLLDKIKERIATLGLGPNDLLFTQPPATTTRRTVPDVLPDPGHLGIDRTQRGRETVPPRHAHRVRRRQMPLRPLPQQRRRVPGPPPGGWQRQAPNAAYGRHRRPHQQPVVPQDRLE